MKRLTAATILACVLASTFLSRAQPGSLDPTFNPGTGANGAILCMALQTNGQIIIGGSFTTFNGSPHIRVARLNTDGSVDGTFDAGGPNSTVQTMALQANGKILISGIFSMWNGLPYQGVVRLRSDGSVDTDFSRINLDYDFWMGGATGQADGKVVIGGGFTEVNGTNRNYVARLNSNGSLDLSFDPGTGANNWVRAVGVQSDGKVIVGGEFTTMNAVPCSHLARLKPNGSVDTNFTASLSVNGGANFSGTFITVLPDDRFIIGGNINSVNGYSRNGIARLNADGSVDTTFNPGSGANAPVWSAAVQPDGKVLVGGGFTSFNGVPRNGIARLNADGSVDGNFNPGTGVKNANSFPVYSVVAQSDGKAVIGGSFTQFNGTNINYIARLNGDNSSTTNLQFMSSQLFFGMNLSGVVSNTYRIEYTAKLNTPSLWTPLFSVTLQTNPQFILDPNPAGGQRFYRAVQLSP